jgi:hypothetical protein
MMMHQQQPKKSDRRSAAVAGAAQQQQPQQQPPKSSTSRSESDSSSSSSDDDDDCSSMMMIGQRGKRTSSTSSTNANNKRPRNTNIPIPRSPPLPPLSIAAERALNRARIHHHNHHHTTATTATTLSHQTHILGAAGRAALLLFQPDDAHHQAIQRMRHHTWPTLLKRALEGINRRARDALDKRLRLAVRGGVATTIIDDATAALAAHVDRAVDFTDRHSVQANAALVRDCLNEIRDDADRNLPTPVPWRECLPPSILLHHLDDATTTTTLLLDAYLADWARADAADEAAVRAALAADLA